MKIAFDPTPFHHSHDLLDLPAVVAELGYDHLQLTPHRDFIPFYNLSLIHISEPTRPY